MPTMTITGRTRPTDAEREARLRAFGLDYLRGQFASMVREINRLQDALGRDEIMSDIDTPENFSDLQDAKVALARVLMNLPNA